MAVGEEGSIITSVIDTWRSFGIFDFVLPFMLVFAIVYGILERTKLFGDIGKSVNAIIAFTIAMTTTLTSWFIGFLTGFLPWVSTISLVVITALMLLAIFAKDFDSFLKGRENKVLKYGAIAVLISLGAVLIWLGAPIWELFNFDDALTAIGLSANDLWGLVFFGAFIAALYFIGRGGGDKSSGSDS